MTDEELAYYDSIIGPDQDEPVIYADAVPGRWIGNDKPAVQRINTSYQDKESWFDRDNDARSPLEADMEDIDG